MFNELVKQIVSVLRYFVPSAVGIATVLLAKNGHQTAEDIWISPWPWNMSPSIWLIVGLIAVQGIAVYYAHRTLVHPIINWFLVRIHTGVRRFIKNKCPKLTGFLLKWFIGFDVIYNSTITNDDLHFARYRRRSADDKKKVLSIQTALDEANAAGHFFYCSAWSAVLFSWILSICWRNYHFGSCALMIMFVVFFTLGLMADYRTTRWDIKAYIETLGM